MAYHELAKHRTLPELFRFFITILGPESSFYLLAILYGIGISVLSLATPISVQMLINTVANIGLTTPLVMLSITLFLLLAAAGGLNALRIHLMDIFARRFYARMVAEIAMRAIYALNPFFDDNSKGPLFNRYFDIIIVVKQIPNLLVGGFTIVLQTLVGFVLVSSYHPLLLGFNLLIAFLIWLIWAIWGKRAIHSALELSHRKHATAAWLEGLAGSNGFFKTGRHIEHALERTDAVTEDYIERQKIHFRHHFSQTLGLLFIYAAASASLLGLGGWLVIQGQLSLGQLVAAELVLSVVFVGLSQLGVYLSYFYDLCAAVEELSLFYDVEQEKPATQGQNLVRDATLEFIDARGDARGLPTRLDFTLPAGARVMARADSHAPQRTFTNLLKRHELPVGGQITLGGTDVRTIRAFELRQYIIVLDRPNAIECTIREYLRFSTESASDTLIIRALRTVGLLETINQLERGLDTPIAATGWPLSISETMQLKLAAAVIARPRVLVLSQIFDVMPEACLLHSLDLLQSTGETTVIYFTNRHCDLHFDHFLHLGTDRQGVFASYEELCEDLGIPDEGFYKLVDDASSGREAAVESN
jgi:ABC-type bacteriocin/lantibiotic exporter with double-glycine peptidase domain